MCVSIRDFGTYRTSEQRRLRRAYPYAQACQRFCFSLTQSIEVDEASDKNLDL